MNSKKTEQIIIGVIILLVGVILLLQGSFSFDITTVSFLVTGFSFALLYKTKRKSWSLVFGLYLIYLGLSGALVLGLPEGVLSERVTAFLASSLFLLITGILLLILYYDKNKRGLLIPGVLCVGISIHNFFETVLLISDKYMIFMITALCFLVIYKQGRYFLGKWPLYVSLLLFAIGGMRLVLA